MKKYLLLFAAALFMFAGGCEQFISEEEFTKFTGRVKDSRGYQVEDAAIFLIYNFDQTEGKLNSNPNNILLTPFAGVKDTLIILPGCDSICFEQNYPNPFRKESGFSFSLREKSFVNISVSKFNGEQFIPSLFADTLQSGSYLLIKDLSALLPANGYKMLLHVVEADSFFTLETNFLRSYESGDSSIIHTAPNAIAANGVFEIPYKDLPIGSEYVKTLEVDPTPSGNIRVNNLLKFVVYKPGYKILQQEVLIDLNENADVRFVLEEE